MELAHESIAFQRAIALGRHASSLSCITVNSPPSLWHITVNALPLSADFWQTTSFQFTIFYFINVTVVSLLLCSRVMCALMLFFVLYFLWMGSYPYLSLYTGFFFLVFSLFKLMELVIRLKAFRPLELVPLLQAFMLIDYQQE